ncbi:MAG: HAD family hydrolase [Blastocatellales bacterium]
MGFDLKAIIFDFNGVIVDDEPLHLELFRKVMAEEGLELTDEEYHEKYLGFDDRGCFTAALTDLGRPGSDAGYIEELIDRKAVYYRDAIEERFLIFPGVIELIGLVRRSYPLAIASGALRSEIELVLERGGIRDAFGPIIAAEDVAACKPDPEGYLRALDELRATTASLQPSQCLVIEDSIAGVEAARRAGMRCLAVTNSYSAAELAAADWIRETLAGFDPAALN